MAMGGEGPRAITVMWIVTALAFVFVVLRTYTRAVVVQSFGVDDHVYNFAFVSQTRPDAPRCLLTLLRVPGSPCLLHGRDNRLGTLWIRSEHG